MKEDCWRSVRRIVKMVVVLAFCSVIHAQGPVDEVDPTIGNVSVLLASTRPMAYLPNSVLRMHPLRNAALDDQVHAFSLTILSHRKFELFAITAPALFE